MAGHFALLGHEVVLYNRDLTKLNDVIQSKRITLKGRIKTTSVIKELTDDISLAVKNAELIMVTTTADAHKDIARAVAPYVEENQIIVLNPGRTLGALEFSNELKNFTSKKVYIAETQSLIYACRAEAPGTVNIIGIKNKILLAAFPSTDTEYVTNVLNSVYECFIKTDNILVCGLENVGAILHPSIVLHKQEAIEKGETFYFYNSVTPAIAKFIEEVDAERIRIGKVFNIKLHSVSEWVSFAYSGIEGKTLYEKMMDNPAYSKIVAPTTLRTRYILEDIPTGILPMIELAEMAGTKTPLMNSILENFQELLGIDFKTEGRTLKNLGIQNLRISELLRKL